MDAHVSATECSRAHRHCYCHHEEGSSIHTTTTTDADYANPETMQHYNESIIPRVVSHGNGIAKASVILAAMMIIAIAPIAVSAFSVERRYCGQSISGGSSCAAAATGISPKLITRANGGAFALQTPRPIRHRVLLSASVHDLLFNNDDDYDEDDNNSDEIEDMPPAIDGFDFEDDDTANAMTRDEFQSLTVAQLKQQLRLRGRKVAGNKAQLIDRLLEGNSNGVSPLAAGSGEVELQPGYSRYQKPFVASTSRRTIEGSEEDESTNEKEKSEKEKTVEETKRVAEAKSRGADIVDVTDFIEVEEVGKSFRSSDRKEQAGAEYIDADIEEDASYQNNTADETSAPSSSSSPEVWGEDARIVDDYEGRSVVVDGLSRTVIEYKGSNNTVVQAYAVGSRDSLKNFLRGGVTATAAAAVNDDEDEDDDEDATKKKSKKPPTVYASMEEEVYAIQRKREIESTRGLIRPDEVEGQEDTSDPGTSYATIERDDGDWGVYTPTGAQLSSSEVQGVLLLSDVYGPFTENTQALADKIAFECQPVVVLVPDMFRGNPWTSNPILDSDGVERNEDGLAYEEWRALHPERRVDVDIRAAASVLRERYAVSSIAVWGTCYGGGRALEAAAGWYEGGPSSYYEGALRGNANDRPPPPHVDPVAAVAWYPTRYDAKKLFGKENEGFRTFESGKDRSVAIMTVFAEDDSLPGATPEDAMLLKQCLDEDPRVKDSMVKIFPGQKHGFAHANLGAMGVNGGPLSSGQGGEMDRFLGEDFGSMDPLTLGGDAEVACLLSTAWMETYTRVFLPTAGAPVRFDADERWSTLEMEGSPTNEKRREVRSEIEESIAKFEDVDIDLRRMSQSASPLMEGPGSDMLEDIEDEREQIRQKILEKYNISEDDDEETFDLKFKQARDDGALDELMLDAYMDGDAYW